MPYSDTRTQSMTTGVTTPAKEVLDHIGPNNLLALSALAGAPAGVAELAFNAFPDGTRDLMTTYGLARAQSDGTLVITDLGHQAIAAAAERCPEPYQDVSLDDVMASTKKAIDELAQKSGVQIREPHTLPGRGETLASSLRRHGQALIERSQKSLIEGFHSYRQKRSEHSSEPAAQAEDAAKQHDEAPVA